MRLLIDANLAILLAVGVTNRTYIKSHKRLDAYDQADFDILSKVLAGADALIFTPNVLSETSNLVRYMTEPRRSEVAAVLQSLVASTEEFYMPSRVAVVRPEYLRLGLTDAVLLELCEAGTTLLTADRDLYVAALRAGQNVVNFDHLRQHARPDFR